MSLDTRAPIKSDGNPEAKPQRGGEGRKRDVTLTPQISIGLHVHLRSGDTMDLIEGSKAQEGVESPCGFTRAQPAEGVSSLTGGPLPQVDGSGLPFAEARPDLRVSPAPC